MSTSPSLFLPSGAMSPEEFDSERTLKFSKHSRSFSSEPSLNRSSNLRNSFPNTLSKPLRIPAQVGSFASRTVVSTLLFIHTCMISIFAPLVSLFALTSKNSLRPTNPFYKDRVDVSGGSDSSCDSFDKNSPLLNGSVPPSVPDLDTRPNPPLRLPGTSGVKPRTSIFMPRPSTDAYQTSSYADTLSTSFQVEEEAR